MECLQNVMLSPKVFAKILKVYIAFVEEYSMSLYHVLYNFLKRLNFSHYNFLERKMYGFDLEKQRT